MMQCWNSAEEKIAALCYLTMNIICLILTVWTAIMIWKMEKMFWMKRIW